MNNNYANLINSIDKKLSEISTLVKKYDLSHNTNLDNDLDYKLEEVLDCIESNADTDFID